MHLIAVIDFLKKVNELKLAKQLLDVFANYSSTVDQYDELGMLYEKIHEYSKSLEMLEKCYNSTSNSNQLYSIRSNFAKVYNHLNEPLKSLYYSNLNLEVNPFDNEAKMEQSFSYYLYGDYKKSKEIQLELLQDSTISTSIKNRITFNIGSFEIDEGLFKQGMKKMILGGKTLGIWESVKKPFERWDGTYTDKTLLIYAEAGIGDQIINVRFMNELKDRNISAIWIGGDDDIRAVFKFNNYNVIDDDKLLDSSKNYVYTDSMLLPVLLDIDLHELWKGTYLNVPSKYIKKWKKLLPQKFVTIRWGGNPLYEQDLHRSLPFILLYDAVKSAVPDDVAIVSLQIDDRKQNYDNLINVNIENWFDTLAIQQLALINITSCTSTAHSAGAIGSRCIVLPPICTYYTWSYLTENKNSHWYGDTTKAFVQTQWKNWDNPINLLKTELKSLLINN